MTTSNLHRSTLHHLTMTNYHDRGYGRPRTTLAGLDCELVPNGNDAVVGDFVYHYSSQLDAFTLCEVVSIGEGKFNRHYDDKPEDKTGEQCKVLYCKVIDSDGSNHVGQQEVHQVAPVTGRVWAYKVYRPDPDQRLDLEAKGGVFEGESDFVSIMAGVRDYKRRLANTLFYVPPPPVVVGLWRKAKNVFFGRDLNA